MYIVQARAPSSYVHSLRFSVLGHVVEKFHPLFRVTEAAVKSLANLKGGIRVNMLNSVD